MNPKAISLPEVSDAQLARLTPRQRDCLRLVAKGYQTKEIAVILGISETRVDKHILAARKILGDMPRGKAARILVEWEARQTPDGGHSLGAQSTDLAEVTELAPPAQIDDHAAASAEPGGSFPERQEGYVLSRNVSPLLHMLPLRIGGRLSNDLSSRKTLIVIAILTVAILVSVGSAVSLLAGLNRLLHS